jgi:hypothetical protein
MMRLCSSYITLYKLQNKRKFKRAEMKMILYPVRGTLLANISVNIVPRLQYVIKIIRGIS